MSRKFERKEYIEKSLKEIETLTKTMDIPSYKRRSVSWIIKNISIRNSSHPNLQKVRELAESLVSMGVRGDG